MTGGALLPVSSAKNVAFLEMSQGLLLALPGRRNRPSDRLERVET